MNSRNQYRILDLNTRRRKFAILAANLVVATNLVIRLKISLTRDKHHIIARSHCKSLGIIASFPGNVKKVPRIQHEAWHLLFGNMPTHEILKAVCKDGWRPTTEDQKAAWLFIFGKNEKIGHLKYVIRVKWGVPKYKYTPESKRYKAWKAKLQARFL